MCLRLYRSFPIRFDHNRPNLSTDETLVLRLLLQFDEATPRHVLARRIQKHLLYIGERNAP